MGKNYGFTGRRYWYWCIDGRVGIIEMDNFQLPPNRVEYADIDEWAVGPVYPWNK
jgi:hypothetical protein